MNIFDSLKKYADGWTPKGSRAFNEQELSSIRSAEVVQSQYGYSVCFFFVGGGQSYIPLSRDSVASLGTKVDVSQAKLLTLSKEGENDIVRVEI